MQLSVVAGSEGCRAANIGEDGIGHDLIAPGVPRASSALGGTAGATRGVDSAEVTGEVWIYGGAKGRPGPMLVPCGSRRKNAEGRYSLSGKRHNDPAHSVHRTAPKSARGDTVPRSALAAINGFRFVGGTITCEE